MANYVLSKGYKVTPGKPYLFGQAVRLVGLETIDVATSPTQLVIGVCIENLDQAKADTGKATVGVQHMGIARMIAADGTIDPGERVGATTGGRVVPVATGGDFVVGIALTGSDAAGDQIDVLLTPGGSVPTVDTIS